MLIAIQRSLLVNPATRVNAAVCGWPELETRSSRVDLRARDVGSRCQAGVKCLTADIASEDGKGCRKTSSCLFSVQTHAVSPTSKRFGWLILSEVEGQARSAPGHRFA